jgi:hypothetical protein
MSNKNNQYTRGYNSFSGVNVKAAFGKKPIGNLSGYQLNIQRAKAPVYTMSMNTGPYYHETTIQGIVRDYLDEKGVEYEMNAGSQLMSNPDGRQESSKPFVITFTRVNVRMFREVVMPVLRDIGRKFDRRPRLLTPFGMVSYINKVKVRM